MRNCLLTLLLLCSAALVRAQKPVLVSGKFENLSADKFFKQIEEASPYFFYYDTTQLDSVVINLTAKDKPLSDLLTQAFQNTDIQFAIDAQHRVFITKKIAIITSLTPDFFKPNNSERKTDHTQALINNNKTGSIKKTASAENKIYEVGIKTNTIKDGNVIVNGYVRNERSGEPVINASVSVDSLTRGAATDQYGYYTLTLRVIWFEKIRC